MEVLLIKIKVKDVVEKSVKVIDKSAIATEKFKDTIVDIKEKSNSNVNVENDANEYASNKVLSFVETNSNLGMYGYSKYGKKSFVDTKSNLNKTKTKINELKNNKLDKKLKDTSVKNIKQINNKNEKTITTIKNSKQVLDYAKTKLIRTTQRVKVIVKVTISSIKAIITGTKALIELLIAGGWIAVVVIVLICIVGMICNSMYGIFFSNEENNEFNIKNVITDINKELDDKIEQIKIENLHDSVIINSNMADWRNVLALYSIKVSSNNQDVITLNDDKIKQLKTIFWEVNTISYNVKDEITNINENEIVRQEIKKVLYIDITSETMDEMIKQYNFTSTQKEELKELLSSDYLDLWDNIIYGTNTNGWIFPVGGIYTITTQFSEEHKALDIASSYGSEIYAIDDGIVIIAKEGCIIGDLTCNGRAGNYITIKHNDNKYYSSYMHLKNASVKEGDKIKKGQVIGYMGNTGNVIPIPDNEYSTNGTHLHFVMYKISENGIREDIEPFANYI